MLFFKHNRQAYNKFEKMLLKFYECILIATTGIGKTDIVIEFIRKFNLNTLVIVPTNSLSDVWSNLYNITGVNTISTITYHSFMSHYEELSTGFDCYVFDEAHHMGSPVWGKAIKNFKQLVSGKFFIGLTADSIRYFDEGMDVAESMFNKHAVYGHNQYKAIKNGILKKPNYIGSIYSETDNTEYRNITDNAELQSRLDLILNELEITAILRRHSTPNPKGIVFVDSIRNITNGVDIIKKAFPDMTIRFVHSKMSRSMVYNTIEAFRNDSSGFIVNVNILGEGHHIDGVNTVIMFRKTSSPSLYTQQVGRCLSAKSKQTPTVFDFVNNDDSVKAIARSSKFARDMIASIIGDGSGAKTSDQVIIHDHTKDYLDILVKIYDYNDRKPWSEEEDEILKKYYPSMFNKVSEKLPGRSPEACRKRAKRLGINVMEKRPWTKEEDEILREFYPTMGGDVYKLLDGRTKRSCVARANNYLNLSAKYNHEWEDSEIGYLKERYPIDGPEVYKELPGITRTECILKAKELGLDKGPVSTPWTEEEDNILREYYPSMGQNVYTILPNRSRFACKARAKKLCLKYLC